MTIKKILLFDVDNTITVPMSIIKQDMVDCLKKIISQGNYILGIVGGSNYSKIKNQLGDSIQLFDYIFTENGLEYYDKEKLVKKKTINEYLSEKNLQKIINVILKNLSQINLPIKRGTFIEFRSGMLNISPIGRNCSQLERNEFEILDRKLKIRQNLINKLKVELKEYNLQYSIGGQISFDVFPLNWDKTFCLQYLNDFEIYFFGDKCFPGGNDFEIYNHSDTISFSVNNYKDTINILQTKFINHS